MKGKNEWYSTHGDIFPVNGAELTLAGRISPNGKRSFPMEERTKPSPEWNHYRLVANNGDLSLSVNGKEVTVAKAASPRKGYLMLESEGGEAHFRNLRIKELPSTNPKPEEIANEAEGFVPLFTGLDLRGWKVPEGDNGHWKVVNQVIDYDAQSESPERDKSLWSEREFGDFQLIVDWRIKKTPYVNPRVYNVLPDGSEELGPDGNPKPYPQPDSDSGIFIRGSGKHQVNIWCWPVGSGEMYGVRRDASMPAEVRAGVTPQAQGRQPRRQMEPFRHHRPRQHRQGAPQRQDRPSRRHHSRPPRTRPHRPAAPRQPERRQVDQPAVSGAVPQYLYPRTRTFIDFPGEFLAPLKQTTQRDSACPIHSLTRPS